MTLAENKEFRMAVQFRNELSKPIAVSCSSHFDYCPVLEHFYIIVISRWLLLVTDYAATKRKVGVAYVCHSK